MQKYEIILYLSNEDQALVAGVLELPGCGDPVPEPKGQCLMLARTNERPSIAAGELRATI